MRLARKIELGGGVATGLLGVALAVYVLPPSATVAHYFGLLFGVETCAALLVAVGAYAHTVGRNSWGRVPLWAGGAVLIYQTVAMILHLTVGLYLRGWVGLFLLLPGVLAVVTLAAALFHRPSDTMDL